MSCLAPGRANPLTAAIHPLRDSNIAITPSSLKKEFLSIAETKSGLDGGRGPPGSFGNGFCEISNNSLSVYRGVPFLYLSKSIFGGGVAKTAFPLSLPLYFFKSDLVFISTRLTDNYFLPSIPGVCAIG